MQLKGWLDAQIGTVEASSCKIVGKHIPRLATQPQRTPTPRHEEPAGEAEIVELLGHIPPDCDYQTWLTVLMALHDRFGGSEVGLAIADNWSAQSCKYHLGEVTAKWRSFKRSGASFASLPAIARDHGACTRLILPLGVPLNQNAPGNLAKRPRFAAGLYAGCMVHVADSG